MSSTATIGHGCEGDREPFDASENVAGRFWAALWRRGVFMSCPRFTSPLVADCTQIVPPLIVSDVELEAGVDALRDAILDTVSTEWR